jgi:hypothetical protein
LPQESEIKERFSLNRRRLEEAHLKYALITTIRRYPQLHTHSIPIRGDISQSLKEFTPSYYEAFTIKYAAHACTFPGCRSAIILDGNMKNRRQVCNAEDAGYVEFPGLPGKIKTGCIATPEYKSKFCSLHTARAYKGSPTQGLQREELGSMCTDVSSTPTQEMKRRKGSGEPVVEMLLEKKRVLRDKTLYKVCAYV